MLGVSHESIVDVAHELQTDDGSLYPQKIHFEVQSAPISSDVYIVESP